MLSVTTVVFVVVIVWAVMAVARGRRQADAEPARRASGPRVKAPRRSMTTAVSAAVGATVVILLGLLVASVWTNRAVASLGASSAVTIKLTGHQWWWEAEYQERHADRHSSRPRTRFTFRSAGRWC